MHGSKHFHFETLKTTKRRKILVFELYFYCIDTSRNYQKKEKNGKEKRGRRSKVHRWGVNRIFKNLDGMAKLRPPCMGSSSSPLRDGMSLIAPSSGENEKALSRCLTWLGSEGCVWANGVSIVRSKGRGICVMTLAFHVFLALNSVCTRTTLGGS